MDKRPKAKHIPNGVIVSSSQSFKHCSHLHARPSKTNSIRHKTKPPSLHVVSSPTAWAHGLLMSQHYRPNPEPLSSLSLSLYRSLFCYIHIFTTPPIHPPAGPSFFSLEMDLINSLLNLVVPPASLVMLAFAWPALSFINACEWVYNTLYSENMEDKVVIITGASSGIGEVLITPL